MIRKFKLEINNPCLEQLDNMKPNFQGFYCNSCAKNVIDLSKKTNFEVGKIISEIKDKNNICARLNRSQMEQDFSLTVAENNSGLKYAAAIAATVLLATNVVGQEKPVTVKETTQEIHRPFVTGKIMMPRIVKPEKKETFTLKGKLIDALTKKPFSQKNFKNVQVYINGQIKQEMVNPKTGDFEIIVILNKNHKEMTINFSSDEKFFTQTFLIETNKIKNKVLTKNFIFDPKNHQTNTVDGGMGLIFEDEKQ